MDANVIAAAAAPAPGFGHFIAQSDTVGKLLLGVLIVMSIASWGLIAAKGVAQFLRNKRATSFLDFFWNARSLDAVQAEPLAIPRPCRSSSVTRASPST